MKRGEQPCAQFLPIPVPIGNGNPTLDGLQAKNCQIVGMQSICFRISFNGEGRFPVAFRLTGLDNLLAFATYAF